jgi:alkylated DNA repair protein alkB homolog 6
MEAHSIVGLPGSGFYIADFISVEEEQRILSDIQRLPVNKWTNLTHRRLLSLPSILSGPSKDTLLASPLPKFLSDPVISRFTKLGIFDRSPHHAPNHVLVNEYEPSQGIMPHTDGPAYHPITATVSLGGHTVLEIYRKTEAGEREVDPTWRVLQEPRSLLVTTDDMYRDTLHGISEVKMDDNLNPTSIVNWSLLGDTAAFSWGSAERKTRVSLTYRDVLKVAKLGGALKFINKR